MSFSPLLGRQQGAWFGDVELTDLGTFRVDNVAIAWTLVAMIAIASNMRPRAIHAGRERSARQRKAGDSQLDLQSCRH